MWDIKLLLIDLFVFFSYLVEEIIFIWLNVFDPLLQNGFFIFNWKMYYQFSQNLTFFFGLKFLLSIAFLVLIRGGTPRYRYDYLTKLGWLKFLGFVISIFFFSLIFFFIY
jgi:NADH:ubiquinone oxidoreductase subunit H